MPLTAEQIAAIQTLKGADAKDFADALQKDAQDLFQGVYQRGFTTAHSEAKTKLEAKDAEVLTLKEQVTASAAELQTLREKTPDVEAVRKDYEAKLQAKEKEKADAVAAAEQRVQDLHGSRFDAELSAQLIALKVDPDYAKEVLVPKYRARRKVEADGTVKFYDDDGATPLAAADGELSRAAAEKIRKSVDAKWILSGADAGGGSGGDGGGRVGTYDPVKAGKEAAAAQKAAAPDASLAFK